MDIKALLIWVSNHVDQVFGTTLVLFFVTSIILLIRSIGDKKSDANPAPIDVRDIEGAMKRVLSTQGVSIAAPVAGGEVAAASGAPAPQSTEASADALAAAAALAQRESKIEELTKELEKARTDIEKASAAAGGESPQSKEELAALKTKLEELQARLAEYEIIEDDIADLSLFKEENARLKEELAAIKGGAPAPAEPKAATAEAPVATAAPASVAPAAEPAPPSEKFELDPNDDVMKEFASAVEVERAPQPKAAAEVASESALSDAVDTDKMLSEVASLDALGEGDASTALEDALDTDKLLAEAGSLEAPAALAAPAPAPIATAVAKTEPAPVAAAPATPAAPAASAPAPAAPAAAPASIASAESDDLLAEFMDSKSDS